MPPTFQDITERVEDLQGKALAYVKEIQGPTVEYVGKAAKTVAARLPEDRPELVTEGITALVHQVDFAKRVLDTQVKFTKAVLDAAVKPFKPARPRAAAKAA